MAVEIELVQIVHLIYHDEAAVDVRLVHVVHAIPEAKSMNVDGAAAAFHFARRSQYPDVRISTCANIALVNAQRIAWGRADVVSRLNIDHQAAVQIAIVDVEGVAWI